MNVLAINCIWVLALSAIVAAAPSDIEQEGVVDMQPPPIVEKDIMDGQVDSGDDARDGVLDNSTIDIYRMEGTMDVGYLDNLPVVAAAHPGEPPKDDKAEGTIDVAYTHFYSKPQKASIDEHMPVEFVADQ